jgi:hypothetical protein
LSMSVKMTPKEMKTSRENTMNMFARAEHPGKSKLHQKLCLC